MKDLVSFIKESKYNNQIFTDAAEALLKDKGQLEAFIKYVKIPLKTEDLRGYVSDYEPQTRRDTFSSYKNGNEDIDPIIDVYIEILNRLKINIDELLDNCPGAKDDTEKWSDICQRIVNRMYNIDKNSLKDAWK